jgi:hypothetical protein
MKYDMQADALYIELSNTINRFAEEFDLNPYTIVGVLEAKKTDILMDTGPEYPIEDEDGECEL